MVEDNVQAEIESEVDGLFGEQLKDIKSRQSISFPKGRYQFRVDNAYLGRSTGQSKRKQMTAVCVVLDSDTGDEELKNKMYFKNWGLENATNFEWLNGDLEQLELEPIRLASDLGARCAELVGICFTGSLVDNKDAQFPPNCYINKGARLRQLEGQGTEPAKAGAAPF